jgi:hypothetical protein
MSTAGLTHPPLQPSRWALERVLFALAGSMTLLSVAFATRVSHWFVLLTALVGANQWRFVLAGRCPASLILLRLFSLESLIYPESGPGKVSSPPVPAERLGDDAPVGRARVLVTRDGHGAGRS